MIAVALGRFDTESLRKYPAELWRTAAATVPVQRLGSVEEYGWLVALLATPLGAALSGSVVTLDGALDNWFGPWPPTGLTQGRRGADRGAPADRLAREPGYHLATSRARCQRLHGSLPSSRNGFDPRRPLWGSA